MDELPASDDDRLASEDLPWDGGDGAPRVATGFDATIMRDVMLAGQRERHELGMRSFMLQEFADLSDGQRMVLKSDRGWGDMKPIRSPFVPTRIESGRELTERAILVLAPDDDDEWAAWVINRLRELGAEVDPASVHAAPFNIEFGPRLQHELRKRVTDT